MKRRNEARIVCESQPATVCDVQRWGEKLCGNGLVRPCDCPGISHVMICAGKHVVICHVR